MMAVMGTVTSTIRRKGKVVGRSVVTTDGPVSAEAIKASGDEARRQAKASDVARHTGKQSYRKKRDA